MFKFSSHETYPGSRQTAQESGFESAIKAIATFSDINEDESYTQVVRHVTSSSKNSFYTENVPRLHIQRWQS